MVKKASEGKINQRASDSCPFASRLPIPPHMPHVPQEMTGCLALLAQLHVCMFGAAPLSLSSGSIAPYSPGCMTGRRLKCSLMQLIKKGKGRKAHLETPQLVLTPQEGPGITYCFEPTRKCWQNNGRWVGACCGDCRRTKCEADNLYFYKNTRPL